MSLPKADLRITSIKPVSGDFIAGEEIKFEVMIKNFGLDASSSYSVVLYDEQDNIIDFDEEPVLDEGTSEPAYLYVQMNEAGSYQFKFVIEDGESAKNSICRRFTWYQMEKMSLQVKGIENTSIKSYYNACIGADDDEDCGIGIKFDFDELPTDAIIEKAVLKLDPSRSSLSAGSKEIGVYRIENYHGWSSVSSSYFDKENCEAEGYINRYSWSSCVDIDITDLVRKWYTGEYANYGMYIFGKDGVHISGSTSKTGYYRYDGTGDIKVEITYLGDWEQVSINPYDPACGHLKIDNITYPLHVPFMTSTSNPDDFIHGDGWSDILTPKIETKLDINWWAIVAGINPPNSVDLQVASDIGIKIAKGLSCFSFIMGLINSALANTTALKLKAYRQSDGSQNRALLIYDTSALSAYNYAGKSFLFQSEIEDQARAGGFITKLDENFKPLYQEWLKFTFELPDKKGRKYDIKFTFDSGHKNDPGIGFVYKNIYDELMLRAFRLQGDFIKIVYMDDLGLGYKEVKDITYIMDISAKLTGQTKTYVEEILTKLNATLIEPN